MNEIIVQKFGGTSVGSAERIVNVAKKVGEFRDQGHDVIVVVSAMSGETNRLTELAREISLQPKPREIDVLLSTGEQVTIALLAMALESEGYEAVSFTGGQIKILTDDFHTKARIKEIETTPIRNEISSGKVVIVAGFQGVDSKGNITTLGRGGSDTTAVALAAALDSDECQIYTDVKGVYTTDPRVVEDAKLLSNITFEEMLELSSLGAKVLQIRAVEFAGKYKVPLRVLSSFEAGPGTLINVEGGSSMEEPAIAGIAFERDEAKLNISGVPDIPGIAYKVIGPVSEAGIEVDVIVQNVSVDGKTDFTFTVSSEDQETVIKVLESIKKEVDYRELIVDSNIAKVSLVGVGMRSQAGVASKAFKALSENNVNIQIICTSEIKITMVIDEQLIDKAVSVLHKEFELEK